MPQDNYTMGIGYPPAYQISAEPYCTASTAIEVTTTTPIEIKFPRLTRFFVVTNTGTSPLRVGFTSNGVLGKGGFSGSLESGNGGPNPPVGDHNGFLNAFVVPSGTMSPRMELRLERLFFLSAGNSPNTSGFSVIAGLSPIQKNKQVLLTGSNGYMGVG